MPDLNVSVVDHITMPKIRRTLRNHFDQSLLQQVADAGREVASGRQASVTLLYLKGRYFRAVDRINSTPQDELEY
jgi:hypothetical protein